jgi:3-dehydroquinate synthetase
MRPARVGDEVVDHHDAVLRVLGLEGRLPAGYDPDELLEAMTFDKKARHDLSFVLAGREGYSLVNGLDRAVVANVLEQFKGES